jgi:Family of unknown function (DUF6152)
MTIKALAVSAIALTCISMPVFAHHSFAMFDAEKTVTLDGVVKQLEWANPHCWLYLMVQDQTGKAIEYSLEMQGPGQSLHNGWKPDSVKPGDKISAQIHPLRTGAHGGQLLGIVLPTGQRLAATGRPPSPITGE